MDKARLTYLFNAYVNKTASRNERDEFMEMLADAQHDDHLRRLLDAAWESFVCNSALISEEKADDILSNILNKKPTERRARRFKRYRSQLTYWSGVAALLILAFTTYYFLFESTQPVSRPVKPAPVSAKAGSPILPGGDKAVLTLSDGSHIVLDTTKEGLVASQGNASVLRLNKSTLAYNEKGTAGEEVLYNTLSTPNGGQYQLILPDGSRVWLNASSSIYFPTRFSGKERHVTVSGEAYFEVAKNSAAPFIISVKDVQIEVLGTEFDVMAYHDEASLNTTLVEGSVKISKGSAEKILTPGQESRISASGEIKIVEAEIEEVTAWKNGWFQFAGYDIKKVMRQISRWYDVDVVYQGKIPAGHFSGIVSRKNDISQVLKILEAGGVRFRIEGRKVLITS